MRAKISSPGSFYETLCVEIGTAVILVLIPPQPLWLIESAMIALWENETSLTVPELMEALKICLQSTFFVYSNVIYKQILVVCWALLCHQQQQTWLWKRLSKQL